VAKAIMIQGTMSSAGKSFIAAALCRAFTQDGYKVTPFKSQNMALNSFITKDGYEIGRAQAMQAEACKIDPTAYINPILLKPTTDVGSQVIVNGKSIGNMKAKDYFEFKKELIPDVKKAYDYLDKNYDIIVVEGAGSPAEINLKDNDIVNMGLAKMFDIPVLIAGDIDRGGVFAQLYGTVMLLEDDEKRLVKGLIINKFRGDKSILESGFKMIEDLCGVPVVGALPMTDADIDDEDSLSERLNLTENIGIVDIAVIKLPKVSNFTDLNSLSRMDGISVRYVSKRSELRNPDLIVIPGSKSTIKDLSWLRESGLEAEIKKLSSKGTMIIGICGGYQMLGKEIKDPLNTETGGEIEGMGLLDTVTVFEKEKYQQQTNGKISGVNGEYGFLDNCIVDGYEIHMGRTHTNKESNTKEIFIGNNPIGAYKNNVLGTYIHGFFDSDDICNKFCEFLYSLKGVTKEKSTLTYAEYKDKQYDKIADELRKNIDMEYIYKVMGLK